MKIQKSYLKETSFEQVAKDVDELDINGTILFSTLDPCELKELGIEPYMYYVITKTCFSCQNNINNYCVGVWFMGGEFLEVKSIDILSNEMIYSEEERQNGIAKFLKEYCEKYSLDDEHNNKICYYYEIDDKLAMAMEEHFSEV